MSIAFAVPDRRLPFSAALVDCVIGVLAFPVATMLVAPEILAGEDTQAALGVMPLALVLLNVLVILINPPEPPVWNVPRAIVAGVWRATLLFIGLLWALVLSGTAAAVPVGLFVIAWGCLVLASAVVRTLRLAVARRIPI
jgi:hypothetical protein